MKQTFEAESDPDLSATWKWFEFQGQLIAGERRRFHSVLRGQISADNLDAVLAALLLGSEESEVDQAFETQRMELELLTMLALLVTAEALLRLDFAWRVKEKLKDSLSRRYREIEQNRKDRVRLDADILEALKQELSLAIGRERVPCSFKAEALVSARETLAPKNGSPIRGCRGFRYLQSNCARPSFVSIRANSQQLS